MEITRKLLDEFESVLYKDPYYIHKWNRERPDATWKKMKAEILELIGEPITMQSEAPKFVFSEPNRKHDE